MKVGKIEVPLTQIEALCAKYRIRELAIFGSALREDFRPESDVDVLVDFKPGHGVGLIEYFQCQEELAGVIGRRVDLVQKSGLKHLIRNAIIASSRVVYAV